MATFHLILLVLAFVLFLISGFFPQSWPGRLISFGLSAYVLAVIMGTPAVK